MRTSLRRKARTDIPPVVSPEHLAELLKTVAALRLLDVRTPGEFDAVHVALLFARLPYNRIAHCGVGPWSARCELEKVLEPSADPSTAMTSKSIPG